MNLVYRFLRCVRIYAELATFALAFVTDAPPWESGEVFILKIKTVKFDYKLV